MFEDWKLGDCKLKWLDDCWLRGELVPSQKSCVPIVHRNSQDWETCFQMPEPRGRWKEYLAPRMPASSALASQKSRECPLTSKAQRANPDRCFYPRQGSYLFWGLILFLFYFVFVNECGLAHAQFQNLTLFGRRPWNSTTEGKKSLRTLNRSKLNDLS